MAIIPCFKSVLDHLHSLHGNGSSKSFPEDVHRMESQFRTVRTLYMCITKCGQGMERCESVGLLIEDALPRCALIVQSFCYPFSRDDRWVSRIDGMGFFRFRMNVEDVLSQFLESIRSAHEEIENLQRSPLPVDELVDLINSLLENLQDLLLPPYLGKIFEETLDALEENVRFLRNLIRFAALRGVQHPQTEHLLTLTQAFLLDASFFMCWYFYFGFNSNVSCKISELLLKIKPVEPRVHEIYVHVLLASKSSPTSTPAGWTTMLGDFIDSLKHNLFELLILDTCPVSFKYQIHKLREALIFLKVIVREQQNKFDHLYETRNDLIGVVICEAGIIICSLVKESNEQGLVKDLDSMFSSVFDKINVIKAEAAEIYPITSELNFPRTNMLGLVDSVLKKLESFNPYKADSVALAKDQFQTVQEGLVFLTSFLGKVKVEGEQQKKLQTLWTRAAGAAYQIEFILDSLAAGDPLHSSVMLLNSITEEIKLIRTEALETFPSRGNLVEVQKVPQTSRGVPSVNDGPVFTDYVVGFDDEAKGIIHKLLRGTKNLDIISIVGMPGIGKTTLAKKIYNDPSICKHFQFRSWCTVSQEYSKNNLLRQILQHHITSEAIEKNEDDLAQLLYRCLKGKTYLIILDDVWDCHAWNDLRISFPDNGNQSRVLLTSRQSSVAQQIRPENEPHALRLLNIDESWELLQTKAFGDKSCPDTLRDHGKRIAQKCKGLPLTIVLMAGILATTEPDAWKEVEDHLSEAFADQCNKVLELSYYHLPGYLKSCFLYFAIFQEDQQVPVQRLLWLWIAEGFVERSEEKCLEQVALDYMVELIERNLVIVAKKAFSGGVKACIVHDVLRDFCVAKSKEENFSHWLRVDDELHTLNEPTMVHRLCVYPTKEHLAMSRLLLLPYLRNLLLVCDDVERGYGCWYNILHICRLKLARILDLRGIALGFSFPSEIELFVHLRYLAIRCSPLSIPSSLGKLSNLETFILVAEYFGRFLLPENLWNMKNLRHLWIENAVWELPQNDLQGISCLENLHTLSVVLISTPDEVLQKLPCARQLKCQFHIENKGAWSGKITVLDFMGQLESLQLKASGLHVQLTFQFPFNLKKLVLMQLLWPWSKISTIAELPNLEVLELRTGSFLGDVWDMQDVQFSALRVLKISSLDSLVSWTGSDDHFLCLQKLELRSCRKLQELPSCLGYISTLEMIRVQFCHSAVSSIQEIREMLTTVGNEDAKIDVID